MILLARNLSPTLSSSHPETMTTQYDTHLVQWLTLLIAHTLSSVVPIKKGSEQKEENNDNSNSKYINLFVPIYTETTGSSNTVTNGTSQPQVSNGTSQPSVSNGTGQPQVSNGTSQPQVSNGTSQPSVSNGTSQPQVSNGTSELSVSNGTSQPPVSNGTNQPSTSTSQLTISNVATLQAFLDLSSLTEVVTTKEESTAFSRALDATKRKATETVNKLSKIDASQKNDPTISKTDTYVLTDVDLSLSPELVRVVTRLLMQLLVMQCEEDNWENIPIVCKVHLTYMYMYMLYAYVLYG